MTDAIQLEAKRTDWSAWAFLALALGILILAHGCHGPDEDHELFGPRVDVGWAERNAKPTEGSST